MTDAPFVVAIPTIDRLPYLRPVVDAVRAQLDPFPTGSLLVIDNGSSDGTADYLRQLSAEDSRVTWFREGRRGIYHARAAAIEQAAGEFIIFLDDDAVPQSGWLAGLLQLLESDERIGVVGCGVDPNWAAPPPPWLTRRHRDTLAIISGNGPPFDMYFPCFPASIGMGIRRNECARLFIDDVRRQDYCLGRKYGDSRIKAAEQLVGGEETDLCQIYAENGYRVVLAPSLRVTHRIPETRLAWSWFSDKFYSDGMSRIRLLRAAGYSTWGRHAIGQLAAYPFLCVMVQFARALPRSRMTASIEALFCKSAGAWHELLNGPRMKPLPYRIGVESRG